MKQIPLDLLLGGGITTVGVLILLINLGVFGGAAPLIWALLLVAGGCALLTAAVDNHTHWWALIPGTTLLSLGLLVSLTAIMPTLAAAWGGTLVLGGAGLGFLAVYLLRLHSWWAIIPAGALLTLAVIAGLPEHITGPWASAILFGGLTLTFVLVAIAPPTAPQRWALFVAGGLLVMTILVLTNTAAVLNLVGPVLLALWGTLLLYRASHRTKVRPDEDTTVSQPH